MCNVLRFHLPDFKRSKPLPIVKTSDIEASLDCLRLINSRLIVHGNTHDLGEDITASSLFISTNCGVNLTHCMEFNHRSFLSCGLVVADTLDLGEERFGLSNVAIHPRVWVGSQPVLDIHLAM